MDATNAFLDQLNTSIGIKPIKKPLPPLVAPVSINPGIRHVKRLIKKTGVLDYDLDVWSKENLSWSDEAPLLKLKFQTALKKHVPSHAVKLPALKYASILSLIKSLRLHGKHISSLDPGMLQFVNLRELSLTGNDIETVVNLPDCLEILHLNANRLVSCPDVSTLQSLVHLGLSFNSIDSLLKVQGHSGIQEMFASNSKLPKTLIKWLPSSITSLDLSWNNIVNLEESVGYLATLPHLAMLCMIGNPLFLLGPYRYYVISRLKSLKILDDISVGEGERANSIPKAFTSSVMTLVRLRIAAMDLNGLKMPELSAPENPEQPPDEHYFFLEFTLAGFENPPISTQPIQGAEGAMDFRFAKLAEFDVEAKLRDGFKDRMTICLYRRRLVYIVKTGEGDDGSQDGSSSRVGLSSSGVIKSGSSHTIKGAPAAKGHAPKKAVSEKPKIGKNKKGKDEPVIQWVTSTAGIDLLGYCEVNLSCFLTGENEVKGVFSLLEPEDSNSSSGSRPATARKVKSPQDPISAAFIRAEFKLNPRMET